MIKDTIQKLLDPDLSTFKFSKATGVENSRIQLNKDGISKPESLKGD